MIDKIRYLQHIPFEKKDIIIIGSAVLIAHGVSIINNDLDVVVRPETLDKYLHTQGIPLNDNNRYKYLSDTELYRDIDIIDKTFSDLNSAADIIEGYTFMSLFDLRLLYTKKNRNKDREKITIIDKLLDRRKENPLQLTGNFVITL